MVSRELPVVATQTVSFEGQRLRIGRDEANDLVLADPNVSRFHAELLRSNGTVELVDLGSRNGTRMDGELVDRARLGPATAIGIGPFRLLVEGESVIAGDEHGTLRLDADAITFAVKDRTILEEITISIEPGELVAIIGESGAGKSTLLKALAGVTQPSSGTITVNGEPLASRLTEIGYVPQDEIVHRLLSVDEGLSYAARLRLPQDTTGADIEAAVDRVLAELALGEHRSTRIGSLSGGQRKRTGVATELLGRPSLLFLDEPTTGMDPGLESKMMELFRELADGSRGVALVTHATKNLALCDRVVVLGRGGVLAFQGSPADALGFFGVDDYDGIYTAIDETPAKEWHERFVAGSEEGAVGAVAEQEEQRHTGPGVGLVTQTRVLTGRYFKLLMRDRKNLALLVGQAPILALAGIGLFKAGLFDRPRGSPGDAIQFLYLAAITTTWLGAIDAAREIIKEQALFKRESAVGMRLSAYVLSKVIVLFGLVTVQTMLYVGLLLAARPLQTSATAYVEVFALLIATGWVAVSMGLLISAVVGSEDQAMSLVPLALIPQLLFAGAVVPLARMAEPAHTIAYAIFDQWSLAALGTAVNMNARMAENAEFARVNRFGTQFFDVPFRAGILVQLGFLALFMAGVVLLLRRSARS